MDCEKMRDHFLQEEEFAPGHFNLLCLFIFLFLDFLFSFSPLSLSPPENI